MNDEKIEGLRSNMSVVDEVMDLTYTEFLEKNVDDLFPDMEEWQRTALQNWMEIWQDQEVQPKQPVKQVRTMFLNDGIKQEMLEAMRAEAALKGTHGKSQPEHEMYFDPHGSKGYGLYCTCGQSKIHRRVKVLNAWAWRHNGKTGHEMRKS